jgi:hypothetical protein
MPKRRRILYPVHFSQAANEPPAGGAPQGNGPLPGGVAQHSAAAQAQQAQQSTATTSPASDDANRAGGPDALKADLAAERQKRHAAEAAATAAKTAADQQLEAFKKALGLSEGQTPEQLKAAADAAKGTATAAQAQLQVFKLAKAAGGDADALLDSASFLASLSAIDANDPAAVTAAIKAAVENNKNLAYQKVAPGGSRDAGQGAGGGSQQPTISDALRALAGK